MRPHCRVFEVVSLPARNRSRQHRTRLPSSKPSSLFLLCWGQTHGQFTKRFVFGSGLVNFMNTILSPLSGRCRCNLVGCWGPDPACASLSLPWWMPPNIWSCWRCHCEAPAGVSSVLGTHHIAVWRGNFQLTNCDKSAFFFLTQLLFRVGFLDRVSRNYKVNMLVLIHVMNGQSHVSLLVVSELLCILLEPIWSLPDRPSQSDSSAWSGSCGHCSQSVSQTLSGRWCWPQHCLRGAQGQMAHLDRRNVHVQQYIVCLFAFHFVTFCSLFCFVVFANLSPSPLPPADDDSLHRCSAPWSSWPNQRYVTWPWQNAAVSSKRSHYWRKDPLRQRETTQLYTLRDQEAGRLP